jgi:hypothetical protein
MTEYEKITVQLTAELKKPKSQQNQARIDKLNKALDKILGTELVEEDQDRAEAWERSRRR